MGASTVNVPLPPLLLLLLQDLAFGKVFTDHMLLVSVLQSSLMHSTLLSHLAARQAYACSAMQRCT
jgi:hypothetical protein